MTYVSWTVGILLALWIVYLILRYVFPLDEKKAISSSEFQATEGGRKALAEIVLARREKGEPIVVPCVVCQGNGRVFSVICTACGGTGVEGGLDYENIDCPTCGGKGSIGDGPGPKCSTCLGKRIIRRDKRKEEEKRGAD